MSCPVLQWFHFAGDIARGRARRLVGWRGSAEGEGDAFRDERFRQLNACAIAAGCAVGFKVRPLNGKLGTHGESRTAGARFGDAFRLEHFRDIAPPYLDERVAEHRPTVHEQ